MQDRHYQTLDLNTYFALSQLCKFGCVFILIVIFPLSIVACGKPTEPQTTVVPLGLPTIFLTGTSTSTAAATLTATQTPLPPTSTPTPTITLTPTTGLGSTSISERDGAIMIYIPAGEFTMGSDPGTDPYFWGAEAPTHTVYLDAYWLYQTEVTNAMYAMCVEEDGCNLPKQTNSSTGAEYYGNPQYADYPVIHVTWYQARDYCLWAGGRLPSEAEWEKGARGNDERLFPWGDQAPSSNAANICDSRCSNTAERATSVEDGYADTSPVGHYPAGVSPYGAYDMAGNVWEWVADWHQAGYYSKAPYENPTGPTGGDRKGMRGGSWFNGIDGVRVVARASRKPNDNFYSVGFRCVMDVKP